MVLYSKSVFQCHLDRFPKYSFPQSTQYALGDVPGLLPDISGIQIHHHDRESAIVIEGSNLWFCYGVSFRGQKLPIPASDISGSSIQFNEVNIATNHVTEFVTHGEELVSLENHFKSKPLRQKVEVLEKVIKIYINICFLQIKETL